MRHAPLAVTSDLRRVHRVRKGFRLTVGPGGHRTGSHPRPIVPGSPATTTDFLSLATLLNRTEISDVELGRQLQRLFGGEFGDAVGGGRLRAAVQSLPRRDDGGLQFWLMVFDPLGDSVGMIRRALVPISEGMIAEHSGFHIDSHVRGRKFGTRFSENSEAVYRKLGIDRIELRAGDDKGAWTWAKAGFQFDPKWERTNRTELADGLWKVLTRTPDLSDRDHELLRRMLGDIQDPRSRMPTPQQVAALSGDRPLGKAVLLAMKEWYGVKHL